MTYHYELYVNDTRLGDESFRERNNEIFDTLDEAIVAAKKAKEDYGYNCDYSVLDENDDVVARDDDDDDDREVIDET